MKSTCWLLLVLGMFVCASVALGGTMEVQEVVNGQPMVIWANASAISSNSLEDPRLIVRRLKRGSAIDPGSAVFSGLTFGFESVDGTGIFDFFNAGRYDLSKLTFTITPGGPSGDVLSEFVCGFDSQMAGSMPFTSCTFQQTGSSNTPTILSFYGGSGLPAGSYFGVDLTGFPDNAQVKANAVTSALDTPEPPAVYLMLAGMIALLAVRRKRTHLLAAF